MPRTSLNGRTDRVKGVIAAVLECFSCLVWHLLVDGTKAIVGASPIVFGPCTLHGAPGQVERTWGTCPITCGLLLGRALNARTGAPFAIPARGAPMQGFWK